MKRCAAPLLLLLLALVAGGASASDVVYDGRRYIDVALQLGSDTVLNFPEDVSWSA